MSSVVDKLDEINDLVTKLRIDGDLLLKDLEKHQKDEKKAILGRLLASIDEAVNGEGGLFDFFSEEDVVEFDGNLSYDGLNEDDEDLNEDDEDRDY
jgi:hypothetical protein